MTRSVATAVDRGRHLVVQAGTGTGKSLAYLVPVVLSGRKVVVATATKALQDQLAEKDLPTVAASLPVPFSFAVLKGRNNYLCRQRAAEVDAGGFQASLVDSGREVDDRDPQDGATPGGAYEPAAEPERLADHVRELLRWAEVSPTGDRAHLPFEPHPRAWAMLSVGPRECPGAFRCPSGGHCFAEEARAAAADADVVVVNTHLYGSHLASGGAVLPPHDVVVFDEAHEVEEVMTSSLGVELAPGRFRTLVGLARPLVAGARGSRALDDVTGIADRLVEELADRTGTRVLRQPRNSRPGPGDRPHDAPGSGSPDDEPEGRARKRSDSWPAGVDGTGPVSAAGARDAVLSDLIELARTRVAVLLSEVRAAEGDEPDPSGAPGEAGRRARVLSAAGHLTEDLGRLVARTEDEVAWVDGTSRWPVLRLSPIDVGPVLAGSLWGVVTAVLTSATIPVRLTERLGLDGFAVDQLDVGSPFDYRTHALLYVARDLPDRRDPSAVPALHDELGSLIEAAGGRTLALFTSRRATDEATAALRDRLPFRLYAQGELPKARLLAEFADDETSCLFATLGFWQGVDIPGRALTLVTLDRLPFARPDDPLLQARRDRAGDEAFRAVDLPRAATLLAQGAGRLIRSADDRGVVAVLDRRLATAGYRGVLLSAMPPMRRTADRRQVEAFLRDATAD
jgi:ATP-dependent DNA helicase DinG